MAHHVMQPVRTLAFPTRDRFGLSEEELDEGDEKRAI